MVGPWEILGLIGRGGIGTVYRARHGQSRVLAAVKLLGPAPAVDPVSARRLAREYEALRGLQHPNVVRVFEAGAGDGYSWLAMELVEGLDLRSYLSPALDDAPSPPASPASWAASGPESSAPFGLEAFALEPATDGLLLRGERPDHGTEEILAFAALVEEPETDPGEDDLLVPSARVAAAVPAGPPAPQAAPLSPAALEALNRPSRVRRLLQVVEQVCEGLDYIHSRGLVHRDLKPGNVMVDDARRARIMDFGLVKAVGERDHLALSGRVVGTYRYMAPEQAQGLPVDTRADLFSLGVILYELLCGQPPRRGGAPGERRRRPPDDVTPPLRSVNPGADPRLAEVAERLLRPEPCDRFQCASEVLAALRG
jgi:serine/threonine protein kinase